MDNVSETGLRLLGKTGRHWVQPFSPQFHIDWHQRAVILFLVSVALILPGVRSVLGAESQTNAPRIEVSQLEPAQVFRAMPVRVIGKNFDQATEIRVRLNERELLLDQPRSEDGKSFTFRVPPDFPLGQYIVRAVFLRENQSTAVLGVPIPSQNNQLRILSDTPGKVAVTGISPLVGYPISGKYGISILGDGFSLVPTDNQLICSDRGSIDVIWTNVDLKSIELAPGKIYARVVGPRQLDFIGLPKTEHKGLVRFQIQVGDTVSDPARVTFSRVPSWMPIAAAAIVIFLLVGGVLWSVSDVKHTCSGKDLDFWQTFLVDQETDTLSLSKFQLYVWTTVAVFGYIYLTVARSMIQGVFEFAPIPDGLPGILMLSGGTTVLAVGVNKTHGSKGSREKPELSDLFATGGVIVPERFQFVIWTIIGAANFFFLLILSDPAIIKDLPKVPDGFLALMGISSAGYLGGKLARSPGPVIDAIIATVGSLIIEIKGRNLSTDATFLIDGREVTYKLPTDQPKVADAVKDPQQALSDATLTVLRHDDDARQLKFALSLRLTIDFEKWFDGGCRGDGKISGSKEEWLKQEHKFSFINRDGQKAIQSFKINKLGAPVSSVPEPEPRHIDK